MKKFTKKELEIIIDKVGRKGFLNKEEYKDLRIELSYGYESWKRELIKNEIPFISGQLTHLFEVFKLPYENNKISLSNFNLLPEWRYTFFKNSKIKVCYDCIECGEKSQSVLNKMLKRKHFYNQGICSLCINKVVRNTEVERKLNSERQKISQNKPDVISKQRASQIKRHKDPELKERYREIGKELWRRKDYREKQVQSALDNWKNPEYASKVIKNSKTGGLSGVYKGIEYDSSYELSFLMKLEENNELEFVSRSTIKIRYQKESGKFGSYYPDFFYRNKLIEVKGYAPWVNKEQIRRKNEHARIWCEENDFEFRMVEFKDIQKWQKKALKWHHENKK